MMNVRPKKSLGQHFLTDANIARKIVSAIPGEPKTLLEIGPGTGMLTKIILESNNFEPIFIETDRESVLSSTLVPASLVLKKKYYTGIFCRLI
jgi:16S rRNA (adenine1518-N6/adenine1519-N6)-dimethyltransferase